MSILRDGISLSIPEGWKVISNDSIGNNAYYFSAEREGKKATGLITITWINKIEDPEKTIRLIQKTMKDANIYRNPGIEFTEIGNENLELFKTKNCHYSAIVKEQKVEGYIFVFNASGKTISLFFQTGLDDKKINFKAFELLKQTFNCRE
ncbi:MAG: hypothetical protein NTV75_01015 [Bacteroidia bacterium]|nr:hypothetical protein [Bacteroidia bacterium]